jgi:hypothetical protein
MFILEDLTFCGVPMVDYKQGKNLLLNENMDCPESATLTHVLISKKLFESEYSSKYLTHLFTDFSDRMYTFTPNFQT